MDHVPLQKNICSSRDSADFLISQGHGRLIGRVRLLKLLQGRLIAGDHLRDGANLNGVSKTCIRLL